MLDKLFAHALKYSLSSLLVTVAGFISFPIFTRLFSVAEYGLISYVSSVLMVLVVLGKLGLQHAIVRFHAEVDAGKRATTPTEYYSTVFYGLGLTSIGAMALGLALGLMVPDAWLSEPAVRAVLLAALPLVPVRVLDSAVTNVLRAQQRSTLLSSYTAVRRYAVLGLVVLATLAIHASVMAFYVATLVAELLATGVMLVYAMRGLGLRPGALRAPLLREMLGFGLPMIVYDLSGVILHLGDRFFIEGMLGPEALGVYSAAYNMCDYASVILLTSLNQALTPMYLKLWETEGKAATQAFVERSLHAYLIASAAIMAAICAMGADALTLLASERYRSGAAIIPAVMLAMLLAGCMPLIGAGLHIAKQTRTLMLMIVASAIVNLALNTVLIPRLGLLGAAYATLGCYVMEVVGAGLLAARVLPVRVPVLDLLKFIACGAAAYATMQAVNEAGPLPMLIVEGLAGLAVFVLALLACDARSRDAARSLLRRRRPA